MPVIMDDPTTYLTRDIDIPVVLLAPSVKIATLVARSYGVGIQVNGPDPVKGIRVVTTDAEAIAIIAILPPATPWAVLPGGWTLTTYQRLAKYFGLPKTVDKALDVKTVGIAWRPDKMMVTG